MSVYHDRLLSLCSAKACLTKELTPAASRNFKSVVIFDDLFRYFDGERTSTGVAVTWEIGALFVNPFKVHFRNL